MNSLLRFVGVTGGSFAPTVLSSRFTSKTTRKSVSAISSFVFGMSMLMLLVSAASAQSVPPAGDTYVDSDSASAGANFGSATGLVVASGKASLVQFDLSVLPTNVTASQINKAVLRLFVN